jgi:hypothetical protein
VGAETRPQLVTEVIVKEIMGAVGSLFLLHVDWPAQVDKSTGTAVRAAVRADDVATNRNNLTKERDRTTTSKDK